MARRPKEKAPPGGRGPSVPADANLRGRANSSITEPPIMPPDEGNASGVRGNRTYGRNLLGVEGRSQQPTQTVARRFMGRGALLRPNSADPHRTTAEMTRHLWFQWTDFTHAWAISLRSVTYRALAHLPVTGSRNRNG